MTSSAARPAAPKGARGGGVALDGLAYGVDGLEAIVAFHLGDATIHAAWVKPGSGFTASAIAASLREVYKTSQVHARRLDFLSPSPLVESDAGDLSDPLVTMEIPGRVVVLRRVRSHVVATFFEATLPLGFVRLQAARIAAVLKPELPEDAATPSLGMAAVSAVPATLPAMSDIPSTEEPAAEEPPARTLNFQAPGAVVVRSTKPPPRGTPLEIDRAKKLLSYLDAHAPDPHIVRLRVSLRAGIKPLALDHPESLGADAMVLLETAVEDILGIDRAELRSKL
jgi:hypothetical protein